MIGACCTGVCAGGAVIARTVVVSREEVRVAVGTSRNSVVGVETVYVVDPYVRVVLLQSVVLVE